MPQQARRLQRPLPVRGVVVDDAGGAVKSFRVAARPAQRPQNAPEDLERMAVERFDVILTDIRMPDLDGRALYREIERRWPGETGRVIFITGDTLATALREFVDDSGRPVIEKPFLPNEVRRVVSELATTGKAAPAG